MNIVKLLEKHEVAPHDVEIVQMRYTKLKQKGMTEEQSIFSAVFSLLKDYEEDWKFIKPQISEQCNEVSLETPWEIEKNVLVDKYTTEDAENKFWNFTQEEFFNSVKDKISSEFKDLSQTEFKIQCYVIHRKLVEKALKEGKKVSENVLKDYPDITSFKDKFDLNRTMWSSLSSDKKKGVILQNPNYLNEATGDLNSVGTQIFLSEWDNLTEEQKIEFSSFFNKQLF